MEPGSLRGLQNLTTLYLHNNNLSTVHNLSSLPSLETLTLYGNPLICDCSIRWLPNYLQYYFGLQSDKLFCTDEIGHRTTLQSELRLERWCPPRIVSPFPEIETYEGQSVKVSCYAVGNPPPELKWYSSDDNVISETKDLIIDDINIAQEGIYTCRAKSVRGVASKELEIKASFYFSVTTFF